MRNESAPPSWENWEERLASLTVPEPQPQLHARLLEIPAIGPAADDPTLRIRPHLPWWKVGIALASTVAVGLVFLMVRPRPAFAEVENALQNVHTATWTETFTHFGPEGQAQDSHSSQVWVRVDPPAYARVNPNGFRSLIDGRGGLVYSPPPVDRYSAAPSQRRFVRPMILNCIAAPGTPSERYRPGFDTGQLTTLQGRSAFRFQLRRARPRGGPTTQETLWADATTHRVLRVERVELDPQTNVVQYRLVAEGYRYDEQPPAGTWDWKAPVGAPVVTEDYHSGRPVWNTLPPEQRSAIQTVIDRSDAAWCSDDFPAFASAWNFGGLERFPLFKSTGEKLRESWRVRFERRKPEEPWSSWRSRIEAAEMNDSIMPYGTLSKSAQPVLMVWTTTEIAWRDGIRRDVTGFYHLEKGPHGYRIINWALRDPDWAKVDAAHRAPGQGMLW